MPESEIRSALYILGGLSCVAGTSVTLLLRSWAKKASEYNRLVSRQVSEFEPLASESDTVAATSTLAGYLITKYGLSREEALKAANEINVEWIARRQDRQK